MIAAARAQFALAARQPDGASLRDHLEAVARATGVRPPELDPPPVPAGLAHVWRWFGDLSTGRRLGAFGPAPLGWDDIAAWAALAGAKPTPADLDALRELDAAYLDRVYADLQGKTRP